MEPLFLVRNPKSGVTEHDKEIEEGIALLKAAGYTLVTIYITDIPTKEAFFKMVDEHNPRTVLALGGDGTVNLLANYLVGTELRLAIIPTGTFNHFAKHIGIGTDVMSAFSNAIHGETTTIDTAEVNGHTFVNFSCVGFYTQLIKRRVLYQKKTWGKWPAFVIATYESFRLYSPLKLRLQKNDSEVTVTTPLVFIGNNIFNFGGPDILASRDDLTSGKLQVSTAIQRGRWGMLRLILQSFFKDIKHQSGFNTVALSEVEIQLRSSEVWVSLDGEIQKLKTPLLYKIRPLSLHVIVPKTEVPSSK